jgi:signal transduction histidine kinase/ligand-binding sensor domain-containing protein
MRSLLKTILLLLISFVHAYGQTSTEFTVKEFTTESGLPSNGIKGLQWDESTGFLWIATEAGIVRYNGISFKTFTKENTSFISSERMSFIARDFRGKIYCADQPKNIISIEKNQPALWIKASDETKDNAAYLIAVSDTFYSYKRRTLQPQYFSVVYSSIVALSDTACFIHNEHALYYFSISMPAPFELRKDVDAIFRVKDECFISDVNGEVYHVNASSKEFEKVQMSEGNKVEENLFFKASVKWENSMRSPLVFKQGKVWQLTLVNNHLTPVLLMNNFPTDIFIRSAQYSEQLNILFIATESKGLFIFYPKRVTTKKRELNTNNNRNAYYSQVEVGNGNILTNEGDIIGDAKPSEPLPIKGQFTYSTYLENDTLLWFSQVSKATGMSYLNSYSYVSGKTTSYPKIIYAEAMVSVGNKMYVASSKGIGLLNGDSIRMLIPFSESAASTIYFQALEMEPGIIAIASCKGLLRFNISNQKLDTLFSKENYCIRSLWKYKEYLFIGSYGSGFYIYRNGKIRQMPLDKNKYLLYTHCFVPDGKGFGYMSTNRGLFKADLNQLIHAFEHDDAGVFYYYFGRNDGMEMTELNGGCTPCALKMKNNIISFPSMDGLLWVDPDKATAILPAGDIFIDEIIVDDKKYNSDSIAFKELPSQTSLISIRLALPAWGNKENIYLDYELNNSGKWLAIDVEKGLNIDFSNLPSGSYNLVIRKLNGFGADNYTYKRLSFYITVPLYKRWWFIVLVGCCFAALFYLLYKLRTRQYKLKQKRLEQQVAEKTKELQQQNEILEKNNTIKTRLISIISHDIVTPLKFVTVAGKELLDKKERMPEQLQQETIMEMTNTAQELQLLSTNILNWIKYQNENRRMAKETFFVQDVVRQVSSILNSLARQKKLEIINEVDADLEVTQYFEPLKILIYNLITNAIHFTSTGGIYITSSKTDSNIIISVKDNGSGMSQEQIRNILEDRFLISAANIDNKKGHGLGYLIIKDLIKMMGATIQIDSELSIGTTVHILLPV